MASVNPRNLKPAYYQILTEVGLMVDDEINKFLKSEAYPDFPEKEILYQKMFKRKEGSQKLRAMAAYLAFSAFGQKNILKNKKIRRIIAAVELENYSNYELNWLFDGKASTKSLLEIKVAGLATHGFMNDALRLIFDMPVMVDIFLKLNDRVHRGWTPELYDLIFDNKKIFSDFGLFWQAYQKRNIEAGGQFYANYAILSATYLKFKDKKSISALSEIYKEFGEGIQVLNDLGDFLTGIIDVNEKDKDDRFADLRNGVVTWPIWLMHNKNSKEVMSFYNKKKNDPDVLMRLLFSSAYPIIRTFLKERRLRLQSRTRQLKNINAKGRGLIEVMISMLSSNRILFNLEEYRIKLMKSTIK
jgi:hypothetical protein